MPRMPVLSIPFDKRFSIAFSNGRESQEYLPKVCDPVQRYESNTCIDSYLTTVF